MQICMQFAKAAPSPSSGQLCHRVEPVEPVSQCCSVSHAANRYSHPCRPFPVLMQASAGQDAADLVYEHIRSTLRTARTLTRYNGVRACLRLLSSQVGTAMHFCRVPLTCQAAFPQAPRWAQLCLSYGRTLTLLLCAAVKVVPSSVKSWRLKASSSAVHMWAPDACCQPGCCGWLVLITALAAAGVPVCRQAGLKRQLNHVLLQASLFADRMIQSRDPFACCCRHLFLQTGWCRTCGTWSTL